MKRFSLKYTLLTYRLDQLWFPLAFWAFFVILTLLLKEQVEDFNIARAYIGIAVPLIGGFMAAYAILDDPANELRFATPVRAAQILFERTSLILLIQTVCAIAYILFALLIGVDFSPIGSAFNLQLAWFVPTVAMIALGSFGAILGAWTFTMPGLEKPNHDLTVVSMLHLAEGTQYRLVGASAEEYPSAQLTQPGLEDAYVWLMKQANQNEIKFSSNEFFRKEDRVD